jgi:hypothetical protein
MILMYKQIYISMSNTICKSLHNLLMFMRVLDKTQLFSNPLGLLVLPLEDALLAKFVRDYLAVRLQLGNLPARLLPCVCGEDEDM